MSLLHFKQVIPLSLSHDSIAHGILGVVILPLCPKEVCMHALKGLALPRASHSGKINLLGSRRLRSTLAAAPVFFAYSTPI